MSIGLAHESLSLAAALLAGLAIGSFVNLLIDRLPRMLERQWAEDLTASDAKPYHLAAPASHCDHCLTPLSWYELIPVLSWLWLRGRCRHCGAAIGLRSPFVEAFIALLFGLAIGRFGISLESLGACVLMTFLVAAAVIDFETRLLPDVLTMPLLWIGLLFNLDARFARLEDAVIGAACGYASLWLVNALYHRLAGRVGMGQGDFKLLAALGAWLGWQSLPFVLIIACVGGVVFGVTSMLRDRNQRGQPIAFGPWLALGALPVLFGLVPVAAAY
jgi:leader peptidase (prepilin peptidase)/N-methyltransferase